jgi:hypothetical protein
MLRPLVILRAAEDLLLSLQVHVHYSVMLLICTSLSPAPVPGTW